jgi:hypothetical protein
VRFQFLLDGVMSQMTPPRTGQLLSLKCTHVVTDAQTAQVTSASGKAVERPVDRVAIQRDGDGRSAGETPKD